MCFDFVLSMSLLVQAGSVSDNKILLRSLWVFYELYRSYTKAVFTNLFKISTCLSLLGLL